MADHLSGGINLVFERGFFRDVSPYEPLQLYQVVEREQQSGTAALPSPVRANGAILLSCVSGRGKIRVGDQEFPLTEGTVMYCRGKSCFAEVSAPPEHLQIICLSFQIAAVAEGLPMTPLYRYYTEGPSIRAAQEELGLFRFFTPLVTELCMLHPMPVLVRGLLQQMLIIAYRSFARHPVPVMEVESDPQSVGNTAYAIIRYVDERLLSMKSLMDMADELGYSYNYLSHLFRRKTGMTIQSYVSHKKIEKSLELLRNNALSITAIASMLNYDCIQSFSKAFKRVMNMSPSEYRSHILRYGNRTAVR